MAKGMMKLSENKYTSMVNDDLWKAPTQEQGPIVSLKAQVAKLQKQVMATAKAQSRSKKGDKQQDDDKIKDKSGKPEKEKKKGDYLAWKKVPPQRWRAAYQSGQWEYIALM